MKSDHKFEVGIYPTWDTVCIEGKGEQLILIIDRVAPDGTMDTFELSRDEAFLLGIFMSLTITKNKPNDPPKGWVGPPCHNLCHFCPDTCNKCGRTIRS